MKNLNQGLSVNFCANANYRLELMRNNSNGLMKHLRIKIGDIKVAEQRINASMSSFISRIKVTVSRKFVNPVVLYRYFTTKYVHKSTRNAVKLCFSYHLSRKTVIIFVT